VVEREGVSISHPARFLLVGTMNEEEGELRPQIADRIGLEVEVDALYDTEARAEIMRRREAFTADPEALLAEYSEAQNELAGELARAERLLGEVHVPGRLYGAIAHLVVKAGVASHRADVTIVECAKALAALAGRTEATPDDVLAAADLALGHRLPVDPFAPAEKLEPQVLRRLLDEALESELAPKKAARG
jgi:Mg-chelatase subunit ChlI